MLSWMVLFYLVSWVVVGICVAVVVAWCFYLF